MSKISPSYKNKILADAVTTTNTVNYLKSILNPIEYDTLIEKKSLNTEYLD